MSGISDSAAQTIAAAAGWSPPVSYAWTSDVCRTPLQVSSVETMISGLAAAVTEAKLVIPKQEDFIRRAVIALLSGHLVLQGPPGTGKTTVARLLARAFNASLRITTATAEWSTYDMIGGLQPTASGTMMPVLGEVPKAALECAELTRQEPGTGSPQARQATWLLVDELNRADIDKSVGPLYTVLSSITGDHLAETPLNLWFETGERSQIWIPTRFRIIATMNDVDTSFVNSISQGLTRRFQFIFLGVPLDSGEIAREVDSAFEQAYQWVIEQYGKSLELDDAETLKSSVFLDVQTKLNQLLMELRNPTNSLGWPLGTAQIVDVWRSLLLTDPSDIEDDYTALSTLDEIFTDRIVPQMGDLDDNQLEYFAEKLSGELAMPSSAVAVTHLRNTRATR